MNIEELFDMHLQAHKTKGNRIMHMMGSPLQILGIFALLSYVPVYPDLGINLTHVVVALFFVIFYIRWSVILSIVSIPFVIGSYYLALGMVPALDYFGMKPDNEIAFSAGVYLLGAIFHSIGHFGFEGAKPPSFGKLIHWAIQPMFMVNYLTRVIKMPSL